VSLLALLPRSSMQCSQQEPPQVDATRRRYPLARLQGGIKEILNAAEIIRMPVSQADAALQSAAIVREAR